VLGWIKTPQVNLVLILMIKSEPRLTFSLFIMAGTLYLVATPIGNLEDITLRALKTLKQVSLIACEDTRQTQKLLNHFQISCPTISYHEHNERERTKDLIKRLESGQSIALVSDAGTPIISDPGFVLVKEAINSGISVVSIPGASAILTALITSGLPSHEFLFIGFLPSRSTERRRRLLELKTLPFTIVCYESPHRIAQSLMDAADILGNRQAVIARELTKLHEEFLRGSIPELTSLVEENPLKGEIVLLIEGFNESLEETLPKQELTVYQAVADKMAKENVDQMTALKAVARSLGISKSEAYRRWQAQSKDS
jgi:16S rRNA (cytidine1402-2'-O)-methyltransferase